MEANQSDPAAVPESRSAKAKEIAAKRRAEAIARRLAKDSTPAVDKKSTSPTVERYQKLLLGDTPTLSARDVAAQLGIDLAKFNRFWLAMGFPQPEPDELKFTNSDVTALSYWVELENSHELNSGTIMSLIRAQSHLADRLAGWQSEALVEEAQKRFNLDDSSARITMVDSFERFVEDLQNQMNYAWRRQLLSLLERSVIESQKAAAKDRQRRFPLTRGVGFVDMVSYTHTSEMMGEEAMVGLIERFEYLCRSVVAARGGRVIKMIGDAVMFNAENLHNAVDVVVGLIEELSKAEGILPVRAAMVWGDVFSRSGDVFGPPVNLAARLSDIAPQGEILVDQPTAAAIAGSDLGDVYSVTEFPSTELRGLGPVSPFLLSKRSSSATH